MVFNLTGNGGLRKLTDNGELISEIPIQGLKPFGQIDHRDSFAVSGHIAIVDIHHVRRFDERMIEVLVGRIEWVVDLEGTAGLSEVTVYVYIAQKESSVAGPGQLLTVNSISACERATRHSG
jgi:hypothetical protein